MSDPLSKPIRRNLIEAITKDPRTIRQFEDMSLDVSENLPALIEQSSQQAYAADNKAETAISYAVEALEESATRLDNQISALSAEVDSLKRLNDDYYGTVIASLLADIAQLKRGGGMSIKRIINDRIIIPAANLTEVYTISPAVDLTKTTLAFLGLETPATTFGGAMARITLTNSTTITASRNAGGSNNVIVSFQLVEYA